MGSKLARGQGRGVCGLPGTFSAGIWGLGHVWVEGKTLQVKAASRGPEAGHAGTVCGEGNESRSDPTEILRLFLRCGALYRVGSLNKC